MPTENESSWASLAAPLSTTTISACWVPTPPGVTGSSVGATRRPSRAARCAACPGSPNASRKEIDRGRRGSTSRRAAERQRRTEVPARRAQDREALAHALGEAPCRDLGSPRGEHAGEQEQRSPRIAVSVGFAAAHDHSNAGIEGSSGTRGSVCCVARTRRSPIPNTMSTSVSTSSEARIVGRRRALEPHAHEEDLDEVAAAGGCDRVDADAGEVGAGAGAPAVAHARVGGAQDRVPGERAQQQVDRVQEQRDRERPQLDLGEMVQEYARRVRECGNAAQPLAGYVPPRAVPAPRIPGVIPA